jgi:voltage-gated potassium channel
MDGPELNDHLIVCGAGPVARYIIEELEAGRRRNSGQERREAGSVHDYLVIDPAAEDMERLTKQVGDVRVLVADPTEDSSLEQAGIRRAFGIFAVLASEKDNLYIALTARQKNPAIRIVAGTADPLHFSQRLIGAGADAVVSPNFIGGMRLVSEAARPVVTAFLDEMLRDKNPDLQVYEIEVAPGSQLAGQSLSALGLPRRTGLLVIALARKGEEHHLYNPGADTVIQPGDIAVLVGSPTQVAELTRLAS